MPVNLAAPLTWKTANTDESAMLADLQANILKGHGRNHTANLFLRFTGPVAGVKSFIHRLGHDVTSARQQLEDTEKFKLSGIPGPMAVFFLPKCEGFQGVGAPPPKGPARGEREGGHGGKRRCAGRPRAFD